MNRILLLVIILVALGAGAWLLLQDAGAPGEPEPGANAAAATAAPAPGTWRGAESVVPPPSSLQRRESETAPPPQAAPAYAEPAAAGEGFLARVVRKEEDTPIPFADVFLLDVDNVDEQQLRAAMIESASILHVIEKLAVRYRAGADGSVRLPLPRGRLWMAGRLDRWFGFYESGSIPEDGVTIACVQMSSVAARVTDAAGQPQPGLPVQLRVGQRGLDRGLFAVQTDAHGIGLIQPLDILIRDMPSDAVFMVQLGGIFAEPVRAEFDPRQPPEQPLELRLPPHGSLEVSVVTADGAPWAGPAFVQLLPVAPDRPSGEEFSPAEGLSGILNAGSAHLRPVGLNQPVRVIALREDGTKIGETLAAGPAQEGEHARVEIREQGGASVLTGRVQRADGQPVAQALLHYELERKSDVGGEHQEGQLRTGEDGGFRLAVEAPALPEGARRTFTLRDGRAAGGAESAVADLSWSLAAGVTDLGRLTLQLPPLLAAGQVVDEAGAPMAGVAVQARPQIFYGKEQFYWGWENDLQGRAGADGAFALHGRSDSPLLRVEGSVEGKWCEPADVPPGSTGLRLVMRSAGSLAGRMLLDESAPFDGFYLNLRDEDGGDPQSGQWGAEIREDGTFSFATLPPGLYELELRPRNSGEPIATLEGLRVEAGAACADPRLQPFDARGLARFLHVRAVDENGQALRHFQVIEKQADGSRQHYWANEDNVLIPQRNPPSDLTVMMEGRLTVHLDDVSSDCQASLLPGPRIRIVLTGAGGLPAGHRLVIGLSSAAGAVQDSSGPHTDVDPSGVAEFNAPLTGLCSISLVMYGGTDGVVFGAWVDLEAAEIDVRPSSGVQAFTVNVDPAKIQEAIAQIAQQRGS